MLDLSADVDEELAAAFPARFRGSRSALPFCSLVFRPSGAASGPPNKMVAMPWGRSWSPF
jgi:hypothetical protein